MSVRNILVCGCGSYGAWLVVGLVKSQLYRVHVYDPYIDNTGLIENRLFDGRYPLESIELLSFSDAVNMGEFNPEVIIVATDSLSRLEAIRNLRRYYSPKAWLLEKVLAPSVEELTEMDKLLKCQKTFVNHTRRYQPFWNIVKSEISALPPVCHIEQILDAWELASNSFHFVDIVSHICRVELTSVDTRCISKKWRESSLRKGCVEFDGELMLKYSNGLTHHISKRSASGRSTLTFFDRHGDSILFADETSGIISTPENGVVARCRLYDSSSLIANCIYEVLNGNSALPSIGETFATNRILLKAYKSAWRNSDEFDGRCYPPIS